MKTLHVLSLATGLIEGLFFFGVIFGWGMIQYVLSREGYFSNYCPTNTNESPESFVNSTVFTNETTEAPHSNSTSTISCPEQSRHFMMVFTFAAFALSISTLPNGFLYDKCGTWIARVLAILLFTLACVLIGISSIATSWLIYPAMCCFSVGGILLLVTNLQIGNLFGRFRSSIITLFSGAMDSSSFVFLLVKIAYDNGLAFKDIILFFAFCTIFLWIRTFLFLPKMHIPYPVPKTGARLGLKDCRSKDKKYINEELKKMKSEEMEQLAEVSDSEKNDSLDKTNLDDTKEQIEKDFTYMDCCRSVLFWSNCIHFSLMQLRNYFFLSSIFDWLMTLADGDSDLVSQYLNVFGTCQFFGVVFAPLNGMLLDTIMKKYKHPIPSLTPLIAVMWSAVATTLLGTLFSITVAIPILKVQYISFILQVIFRSFLYGGNASFCAIAFPSNHFGKVYGLTMTIGGIVTLLQFPLFALVQNQFGGSFFVINIIFVFMSLACFFHPMVVHIVCKKKEKKEGRADSNGNDKNLVLEESMEKSDKAKLTNA